MTDLANTQDLKERLSWLESRIASENLILKELITERERIKTAIQKRERCAMLVEKFNPYAQNLNVTTMRRKS